MFSFILRFRRWLKRLLKVQSESRQVAESSLGSRTNKFIILVGSAVLVALLYPGEALFDPLDMPREGEISVEDVIAPFDLTVMKTDEEVRDEEELLRATAPYVVDVDVGVVDSVTQQLRLFGRLVDSLRTAAGALQPEEMGAVATILTARFPSLSKDAVTRSLEAPNLDSVINRLVNLYRTVIYRVGILPDENTLPSGRSRNVLVRRGDSETIHTREQLLPMTQASLAMLTALNRINAADSIDVEFHYLLGRGFLKPNMKFNASEYNRRLEEQIASIQRVKEVVRAGDIILRSGSRVSERQERILSELAETLRGQAANRGWVEAVLPMVVRVLLVLGAFSTLYLFLYYFRRETYNSNPKILAITLVYALQLVMIYLASEQFSLSIYLYPVAALSIMLTVLFDAEIGLLGTAVLAVLLGILHRFDFSIVLMTMIVGTVACAASRQVSKRTDFLKIMFLVSLAYAVLIPLIEQVTLTSLDDTWVEMGFGVVNGVVCAFLTVGILPFFESMFGITTEIRLLELSDLNHPLLKRLALEAPGTYHHSIMVGNLTEGAAKEVGANPLLARVGAYYHDIGKIEIPEYFVENQLSVKSKHEALTPSMSAVVLTAHVKKGRLLGELSDIPDDVLNFIEEHHGTMVMSYFYNKAVEEAGEEVPPDEYRYPGPKPQTKENGIAMLADGVEAASRTLESPTPARINGLIQSIIDNRLRAGELDECPVTLRDLARIKRAFAKVLIGAFHQRVLYPHQKRSQST